MPISIKSCHIYPVKSMQGQSVEKAQLTHRGLVGDRRFMAIHATGSRLEGKFLTQRFKGAEILATIRPTLLDNMLRLELPDGLNVTVCSPDSEADIFGTKVFSSDVEVQKMPEAAAAFLSAYLNMPLELVYQPDFVKRQTDQKFSIESDEASLADGFALLITNQSSLDELNKHIDPDKRIPMTRFRSNLVLEGLEPFEEDTIKTLQIGNTVLELVKPCTRCQVPNIDQETGEVLHDEPGATLRQLRFGKDKSTGLKGMFFGVNAQPRELGDIRVGDDVRIIERREPFAAVDEAKLGYRKLTL